MAMDVDQVTAAGNALKKRAADIDALVAKLDGIVRSMPGVWEGPDAQQFANEWWPEHKKALVAASSSVAGLGQAALNNASEQRQGSDKSSPGSSGPTVPTDGPPEGRNLPSVGDRASNPGASAGALPAASINDYVARVGSPTPERVDGLGAFTGNCTSWAAFRREQLGLAYRRSANIGTGHGFEMAERMGGTTTTPPTLGAIVSSGGPPFGHVMIVEEIRPDGSFRVSEMNVPTATSGFKPVLGNMRASTVYTPGPNGMWTSSAGGGPQSLTIAP